MCGVGVTLRARGPGWDRVARSAMASGRSRRRPSCHRYDLSLEVVGCDPGGRAGGCKPRRGRAHGDKPRRQPGQFMAQRFHLGERQRCEPNKGWWYNCGAGR